MGFPARGVRKLITVELALFLREPAALFFALAYPIVLVVVNGTSNLGTMPVSGQSMIDASAPAITTFIVSILGLCTLPPFLATYRERGILRRMAVTPMPPAMLLFAQLIVHVLVAMAGMAVVFALGMAVFGMSGPRSPGWFVLAAAIGGLSMFAIGFVLAALASTSRVALAAGLGLFFPMSVVSGGMIPRETLSESVRAVGDFTPMSPVVRAVTAAYTGEGISLTWMLVMVGVSLVATMVAVRTFRW